jgi:hypothetical protein
MIFAFGYDGKLLLSWRGYYGDAFAGRRNRVKEGIKFVNYNEPSIHCEGAVDFSLANPDHLERRLIAYRTASALEFSVRLADSDSELLVPLKMVLDYGRAQGLLPASNWQR